MEKWGILILDPLSSIKNTNRAIERRKALYPDTLRKP